MKVVIVGAGGNVDELVLAHLRQANLIVAADGGADPLVSLDVLPQIVIGDFDSLSPKAADILSEKGCRFIRVAPEKDETDMELAVRYALEQGAKEITLLGSLGGRIDHTFANLLLLASLARKGILAKAVTPPLTVHSVAGNLTLEGKAGDLVSVFPFQGPVSGVSEQGFKYPLDNVNLDPFTVVGTSNELIFDTGHIKVKDGILLVFHYHCTAN